MLVLFEANKQHKGQVIRYLVKANLSDQYLSSHVLEGAEEAGEVEAQVVIPVGAAPFLFAASGWIWVRALSNGL